MTALRKPDYLTKEQIVRGTCEARRLGFAALTNQFLCSLTEPRYRIYGAWSNKNRQGFTDVARICFYVDPRSPSTKNVAMIDVSHDMYAEMLSNTVDEAAKKLLSRRFFQVCPPPFEEFRFTVEFRDYADDDALNQIMVRILDSRLPDWRSRIGEVPFAEAPWDFKPADYIVRERRGEWHIHPCGVNFFR